MSGEGRRVCGMIATQTDALTVCERAVANACWLVMLLKVVVKPVRRRQSSHLLCPIIAACR